MRVAYQVGAIRALFEAGLSFFHIDATSAGGINLAMLLAGLSPTEMSERWQTLRLRDAFSPMPLKRYLKAKNLVALGTGAGFNSKVFPHLGVDFDRIRSARGLSGTFNVCDYARKLNLVIPHEEIDRDWLLAGISLPGVLPPVERGGRLFLDSAFIRDANLMEGVRRGAEELWLVWCLGNTSKYRGGLLQLYIQMLEMSANGALVEDLARIDELNTRISRGEATDGHTKPIRLHLIRPDSPLPLDTDLYLGRASISTLLEQGYRDASRYLRQIRDEGVPLRPEVIMMREAGVGVAFREMMRGGFTLDETDPEAGQTKGEEAGTILVMRANIAINDINAFVASAEHAGDIAGTISFPALGDDLVADSGQFSLFSPSETSGIRYMVYELKFHHSGTDYYLAGRKKVRDDFGPDVWSDTTKLHVRLHRGTDTGGPVVGAGVLQLSVAELTKLLRSLRVTNARTDAQRVAAVAEFGRFFLGSLWENYARMTFSVPWWKRWWRRLFSAE